RSASSRSGAQARCVGGAQRSGADGRAGRPGRPQARARRAVGGARRAVSVIVLDTSVLVYAVGGDHPLRERCASVFGAVADGRVVATTTVDVIQEFACVRARRVDGAEAAAQAVRYSKLLAPLLPMVEDDVET